MAKVSLYFLLSLLRDPLTQQGAGPKHHWTYKGTAGPDTWKDHYDLCGGQRQSPINIDSASALYDPLLPDFTLHNFDLTSDESGPVIFNMTNNGHSANARCRGDLAVEGGGLPGRYKTAGFHFHWGADNGRGSEHALDSYYYPLELHIVNFAEKYRNISYAMKQPDGLAVLGVLFEVSNHDNEWLEPVVESLAHVKHHGHHRVLKNLQLRRLLPENTGEYFRYLGSLTTPPCFESVTWTVFARPQKISHRQLEALRELLYEDHNEGDFGGANITHTLAHGNRPEPMVDNYRPLQPLFGRRVTASFARYAAPAPATQPGLSSVPAQTWQPEYSAWPQQAGYEVKPTTKAPAAQPWNPQISPLAADPQNPAVVNPPDPYADINAASKDGTMGSRANNMPVSGGQESAAAIGGIPNLSASSAKQLGQELDIPAKGAHQRTSHTVVEQMPDIKIGSAVAISDVPASPPDAKASLTQAPSFSANSQSDTPTPYPPTRPHTVVRTAPAVQTYPPTPATPHLQTRATHPPTPPPTYRQTQPAAPALGPAAPQPQPQVNLSTRGPVFPPVDAWRGPPLQPQQPTAPQGGFMYEGPREFLLNIANARAPSLLPPHASTQPLMVQATPYRPIAMHSVALPPVYLHTFLHPMRIRKPFFYSYYSGRQSGAGSVSYPALAAFSNFDIAGLTELRRR